MTLHKPPIKPQAPDEWRPHTTPGFEINGKGQLRTVNHQPGKPKPAPRKPINEHDEEWTGFP